MNSKRTESGASRTLFVEADPVSSLLLGRLRLPPWAAGLLVLGALGAPVYVYAIVNGDWVREGRVLKDYAS